MVSVRGEMKFFRKLFGKRETSKKDAPGFTAVFAIAGLLAVAYAMMRRRRVGGSTGDGERMERSLRYLFL